MGDNVFTVMYIISCGALTIPDCPICKYLVLNGNTAAMEKHVRLMHPERCVKYKLL